MRTKEKEMDCGKIEIEGTSSIGGAKKQVQGGQPVGIEELMSLNPKLDGLFRLFKSFLRRELNKPRDKPEKKLTEQNMEVEESKN